jgi:hypothetical protein
VPGSWDTALDDNVVEDRMIVLKAMATLAGPGSADATDRSRAGQPARRDLADSPRARSMFRSDFLPRPPPIAMRGHAVLLADGVEAAPGSFLQGLRVEPECSVGVVLPSYALGAMGDGDAPQL